MPDPNLQYDPVDGWNNAAIFKDNPTNSEVRPMHQRLFDQIKTFINITLIAWINATFALKTDVLTRTNTDVYTPTAQYHPSTKKYVDDTTAGVVLGQIPDGTVTPAKLSFDPATQAELDAVNTAANFLTKIKTVDGAGSGLDAEMVTGLYLRNNAGKLEWSTDNATWNPAGGGGLNFEFGLPII